jgi:hypothetical protein
VGDANVFGIKTVFPIELIFNDEFCRMSAMAVKKPYLLL